MTSTYTTNKSIEKPANGDYVNNWNVPVNSDWDIIDQALGSVTSINATGASGTIALTATQYRSLTINITGTLTANVNYQIPSTVGGQWIVYNNTTGAFTVTISSGGGGSSYVTTQGSRTIISSDGSSVYTAITTGTGGTVTSVGVSGGSTGLTTSGGPITSSGTITLAGTLGVGYGGTGVITTPSNGSLLIGNGSGYTVSQITAGSGITVTNGSGSIQIASTAASFTGSNGVTVAGSTISMSGSYTGTFAVSGGITATTNISASGNVSASGYVAAGSSSYPRLENTSASYYNLDFTNVVGISWDTTQLNTSVGGGTNQLSLKTTSFTCNVTPYANQTSWTLISDITEKTNITPVQNATSRVMALNPVDFTWIKSGKNDSGFIAQEFEQVYPVNVIENEGKKYIALSMNFYADLVSTIQNLKQEIDGLKSKLGQ